MSDALNRNDPVPYHLIPERYAFMVNPLEDPQWSTYSATKRFVIISQSVLLGHEVYQNAVAEVNNHTERLRLLAYTIAELQPPGTFDPTNQAEFAKVAVEFRQVREALEKSKSAAVTAYDTFQALREDALQLAQQFEVTPPSTTKESP